MTRHKTSSRLLAMLLSLMSVIGMLPTTVFAAGDVAYIGNTGYPTLAQAVSSAYPGDTILLTADDAIEQKIEISKNLTIELDGHSLPGTAFKITGGTVIIGDRKGTGTINENNAAGFKATEGSNNSSQRCASTIHIVGNANVTLNNLRVEQCAEDDLEKAIFLGQTASLTINGGSYTGPKNAGVDAIFYDNDNSSSSLTINDGHFEANCGLSVNKTPGTGGGTLVIRKATFVGNGTAFWIEQENGGVTTQEKAERFLADSSGSYIIGTFDKANIVIGSGLFVSDGFTGPEYGSTDSDNPAQLIPEEGESITLLPQILGGDGSGYTYTWYKDSQVISDATGSSYTIENYQSSEDDGIYSVTVSQGNDSVTVYWKIGDVASIPQLPGEGTEQATYEISTPEQLMAFAQLVNSGSNAVYAKLIADIDMSGQSWTGISINSNYTGVFDGQGHIISNLTGTEGLFVNNAGTVKNVRLENVALTKEGGNLGAVVGVNTGTVFNCISSGSITGTGSNAYSIGGLIGHNNGGTLSGSFSSCTVGGKTAGGLAGSNWNDGGNYGKITACIYTGNARKPVEGDNSYGSSTDVYYKYPGGACITYPQNTVADEAAALLSVNNYILQHGGALVINGDGSTAPNTAVSYLDVTEDGFVTKYVQTYNVIGGENVPTEWNRGWYVVEGDVTINSRVTVQGDVKLILRDSSNLTVNGGIDVSEGNSFTVYAQSTDESMGQLTSDASNVNYVAGIGGGNGGDGGTITINGGTVTATGGTSGGAGIGGGYRGSSGAITLSGGIITATGGKNASGIGGGYMVPGGNISTGENGTAVIFASFIPTSNTTGWKGLIFNVNNGKIYGDSYTVEGALTIPDGKTLTVEDGKTLNGGANITNNGTIKVNMGGTYSGDQPTNNKVIYQIDWDTDGDGDVDETEYVAYGETPSHEDGSKASTTDTVYTFTGWDPEIVTVTGTATYTARFSSDTRTYTVTVPTGEGYTIQYSGGTELPYNSNFTFTVEIGQGYYKTAGFAVQVNGTALTPDKDGNYTVEVLTDTRITVEGVAKESALAAPTVDTHGYDGAWTADNVTLTPSATADSGIAYYEYSKDDGKSWTSLTGNSLTISESDFAKDYIFRAVSNAGNVSPESDPVTVQIDKAKPGVTFDGNITDYLQEDTLKIIPIIGLSGISQVELKKDNGEWITLNPSADNPNTYFYTVTENGLYTVRVTSGTGVVGDEKSITYDKIDSTEPVVTIDSGSYRSGNWTNENVTLSVSNTASNLGTATFWYKVDKGEWQAYTDDIIVSEETDGTVYTFKAISASGVESAEASITVKLDKTAPDGDVEIAESSVKKFINTITFGLFFNQNVDVTITGTDDLSGVAAVEYYRSEEILTEDDVLAIEDWTVYSSISETAEDAAKFVYYVKITDHAGNVTYFGSDGVTFDLTAPVISGVTGGATYYTTQIVTVADENFASVTVNDVVQSDAAFTLPGNAEKTYTIAATDKAGNVTTYEVTMKPIASLAETIEDITNGNVTSEDKGTVETVKEQVKSIDLEDATEDEKEALQEIFDKCDSLTDQIEETAEKISSLKEDVAGYSENTVTSSDKDAITQLRQDILDLISSGNLSEEEKAEMQTRADKCESLSDKIEQTAQAAANLEEALQSYDPSSVTSGDKETIEQLKEDLQNLINSGNLTGEEKAEMEELVDSCDAMLEEIAAAGSAGSTENTDKVENVSSDNVKPEDKDDLTQAKEDLENALKNFGDNYTEEERAELEEKLEQINNALDVLEKVETVQGAITSLPDAVEPDDTKAETHINTAKEQYDQLTEYEKSLLPDELKEKLESLLENLLDYRIIAGNGSQWTAGDDGSIVMTANGPVEKFIGIEVDGKAVDSGNYTVKSGSTIITLKPEYLNTLSAGKHTLTVIYTDGETSGAFEIVMNTETATPETGDNSNIAFWMALMFMAACALTGTMAYSQKRKYSK